MVWQIDSNFEVSHGTLSKGTLKFPDDNMQCFNQETTTE